MEPILVRRDTRGPDSFIESVTVGLPTFVLESALSFGTRPRLPWVPQTPCTKLGYPYILGSGDPDRDSVGPCPKHPPTESGTSSIEVPPLILVSLRRRQRAHDCLCENVCRNVVGGTEVRFVGGGPRKEKGYLVPTQVTVSSTWYLQKPFGPVQGKSRSLSTTAEE